MPSLEPHDILFFATPAEFRAWLAANHSTADELWVGYYKKATGRPSMTWAESVDEALCYGWIDGQRRRLDDERYTNRFTPRRRGSIWSEVNSRRVAALIEEGRMQPAGLAAYEARDPARMERALEQLDDASEAAFRAHPAAWEYWQAQPSHYRRAMSQWVMSAKREETRRKRLAALIEDSAAKRWNALYRRAP